MYMWKLKQGARELTCGVSDEEARLLAPGTRWKAWVAATVLIVGLFLIGAGTGVYFYLDARLRSEIEDFVIVDSPSSYGYEEWVFNGNPDAVPLYASYFMWNLTNAQELQAGTSTVPNYQAIGPFNYRKYIKKIDISFLSKGEQVSFSEYVYYAFSPQNSYGDPDSVLITNINQAYMGVLALTNGEQGLVTSLLGPTLGQIINLFSTTFVDIVAFQGAAVSLPAIQAQTITGIQQVYNVSFAEAQQIFYNEWANSTSPNPALWGTLGTLCGGNGCTPSGISTSSVISLWTKGPLPNFVNSDPSVIFLWYQASISPQSEAAQLLQTTFSLTPDQLGLIFAWLSSLNTRVIIPGLLNRYQVSTKQEIGIMQWGTGAVTNYTSVKDMVASNPFNLAGIPEFALWANRTASFNVTQCQRLISGQYALTSVNNMITFLTLLAQGNQQTIQALWGLSFTDAITLSGYFNYLGATFVQQSLDGVFNTGNTTYPYLGSGSLFTTRTVTQWLWGVEDPLLKLIQFPNPVVTLQVNQTSEDQAYQQANNSILWTGRGDLDRAFNYVNWKGLTFLPQNSPWAADVPIVGDYGNQFRPFLSKGDTVIVWIPEILRSLTLQFSSTLRKFGIELNRYTIASSAFVPNPVFYQSVNFTGFANMTRSQQNVAVFISKPRMLDCPAIWREKVTGQSPTFLDDTFIDIEPYTGYVMDVDKQLQINIHLQSTTGLNKFNTKVPVDVMYPIFWNNLNAEITPKLADDFKSKVYTVLTARYVTWYVTLAVGCSLLVVFLLLVVVMVWFNWRYKKAEYLGIPEHAS